MTESNDIYVPWQEGATLLGVKRSAFFYRVNCGQIREEPGRGPRDGRYSLRDIEAIKERQAKPSSRRQGRRPGKKQVQVELDWLAPADIPAILRLDQLVYNEFDLASAERYMQWSEKNPELAMCAFDARSNRQEMLAYVACLPLDEEVILSILRGEREETSITMEEIQTYERPGPYTLLANSAVCLPDRPELLYRVLEPMVDAWIARYPERYVTRLYAQSWSERGDMLIQHFFMAPRYDLAPNAFMLDLARPSASKIIRRFQERLLQKVFLWA